jgi:hypothetical protein
VGPGKNRLGADVLKCMFSSHNLGLRIEEIRSVVRRMTLFRDLVRKSTGEQIILKISVIQGVTE